MVYLNKIPLSNRLSIVPTVIIYSILVMIHNFKKKVRNTQIISNYDNTQIISNYFVSFHNFQQFPTAAPGLTIDAKTVISKWSKMPYLPCLLVGFCPNVEVFMGFPRFFSQRNPGKLREHQKQTRLCGFVVFENTLYCNLALELAVFFITT